MVIQLPCSGRVDILHLLKAFEDGADGVYVAGCLDGDCHYLTGNFKARRKINYVKKVLKVLGIEQERVEMFNMSSADGSRFATVAQEFTVKMTELGPSLFKIARTA